MEFDRKAFRFLFLRENGEPRNYEQPNVSGLDDEIYVRQYTEIDLAKAQAEADAFKKTQRKFALGVIAVVGTGVNLVNPPENIPELALNLLPAVVVQTATYYGLKNGIHLMRDRLTK